MKRTKRPGFAPQPEKNVKKASAQMKASDESLLLYSFILKHFEKKEFCIGWSNDFISAKIYIFVHLNGATTFSMTTFSITKLNIATLQKATHSA